MKFNKKFIAPMLGLASCMAIGIGTTYALFTSEDSVEMTVTAGKVAVKAALNLDEAKSLGEKLEGDTVIVHKEFSGEDAKFNGDYAWHSGTAIENGYQFENGGTATVNGGNIILDKLTPGDHVEATLKIDNLSNVATKYMISYRIGAIEEGKEFSASLLTSGLKVVYNGTEMVNKIGYNSAWNMFSSEAPEAGHSDVEIKVVLELPIEAGNLYQDTSAKIEFKVNAVQGNAVTVDHEGAIDNNLIIATPSTLQSIVNGEQGAINGHNIVLTEGEYSPITVLPTKYSVADTQYYAGGFSASEVYGTDGSLSTFLAYKGQTGWTASSYYVRSLENISFVGVGDVKVAGFNVSSGHYYGTLVHDYVLDRDIANSAYYFKANLKNINFSGITFTKKSDIQTSIDASYKGIGFTNCAFDMGTVASGNQAIRFYSEAKNTEIKTESAGILDGLTVKDCAFHNVYQGIYSAYAANLTVDGCSFDTTGHNAIAVQNSGAFNHKGVTIINNTFNNIGDRIIRFGHVGANTQITIKGNRGSNYDGDEKEVMKAVSLAEGITYNISNNNWGEGAVIPQVEFEDAQ